MQYILVRVVDCYAARDLLRWFVTPKKVPGTLTIHNVMVSEQGKSIITRKLSCYEDCCWNATTFKPVYPRVAPCKTHSEWTKWTKTELYNEKVHKKLEKKRVELAEKDREEELKRIQKRDERTVSELKI